MWSYHKADLSGESRLFDFRLCMLCLTQLYLFGNNEKSDQDSRGFSFWNRFLQYEDRYPLRSCLRNRCTVHRNLDPIYYLPYTVLTKRR